MLIKTRLIGASLCCSILLSGCIYKMDIHQGNVLEADQIAKLMPGMSKNEVIAILGTPQLTDPFHTQRWDYFSSSNTNNQRDKEQSLVTLVFEDNVLATITQ